MQPIQTPINETSETVAPNLIMVKPTNKTVYLDTEDSEVKFINVLPQIANDHVATKPPTVYKLVSVRNSGFYPVLREVY